MTVNGESFGGSGRVELLARIAASGSIAKAAKSMRMSYKGAWDAIDAMSKLAGEPLLERLKGGKGGGGTRLTQRGEQLVANFRTIEREHRCFVDALSTRSRSLADDLILLHKINESFPVPAADESLPTENAPPCQSPKPVAPLRDPHGNRSGGTEIIDVADDGNRDSLRLWEKYLPEAWRNTVALPRYIKRFREYEVEAERSVGYDANDQPCFISHMISTQEDAGQEFDIEALQCKSHEIYAWRLGNRGWLAYRVTSSIGQLPRGMYEFCAEMPR